MKPVWRIADGTRIELGGRVTGDSAFARELRQRFALRLDVDLYPPPGGNVPFDPNRPHLVDVAVRTLARQHRLEVLEAPEVTYPPDPRAHNAPPGAVY